MKKILIFIFLFGTLQAEEPSQKGKLIVTYQTGAKRERLDRIRFWLTDPQLEMQMYPKENGYVDDQEQLSRMVVIEDLAEGDYQIEFVVPNADGLFEEIPKKTVAIKANTAVKIDQPIRIISTQSEKDLKYGTLLISYEASSYQDSDLLKNVRFRITDSNGVQNIYPQTYDNNLAHGNVFYLNLPVGTYVLEFFLDGKDTEMQSIPIERIAIEQDRMTMLEKTFKLKRHQEEVSYVDESLPRLSIR